MIDLPPSVVSALVGAAVGGLLGIIGSLIPPWYNKRIQHERLRKAFVTEIEYMENILDKMGNAENPLPTQVSGIALSTRVFDENIGDIGIFEKETSSAIIKFYSDIMKVKVLFDEMYDIESNDGDMNRADMLRDILSDISDDVKEKRDEALEQLGEEPP